MSESRRSRFVRSLRDAAPLALLATTLPAQIWSEEFDTPGAPDPSVWSYDLGAGGWGNSELQTYTSDPSNVRVENGHLIITARPSGSGFTSARIKTQDKLTFQYGTVEARIQVPDLANGLWPAFWTLGNNFGAVSWPDCGEIDVLEMGAAGAIANNQVNRRVYSTAHWEFNNTHASYGLSRLNATDLDGSFHVWRLEWTPWALITYIDNQFIWSMDISNPTSFDGTEFHAPHFFLLNMAVGGTFPNIFNGNGVTAPLPAEYRVDYIRIFDNGHTILDGSALTTPATATPRSGTGNLNGAYVCTPPVIGAPMTAFLSAGLQPFQFGGVLAYLGEATLPFGNYTLLVDPASLDVFTFPLTPLQGSSVFWTATIPNDNVLVGLQVKTQGVLVEADLDFALTNAVDLQVGN